MSQVPLARLSNRPPHPDSTHSRSFSSLSPQSSVSSISTPAALQHMSNGSEDRLLNRPTIPRHSSSQQYVKWGITWQPPTAMLVFVVGGIILAIGHHFYFLSLDGKIAGSSERQQWATRFGTAFSFLVVALFKMANDTAYNQYIWTLVRGRPFSIAALDRLFVLTSDLTGFVGFELMKHAKLAIFLALICRIIAFAGVTPPATLSVVPGLFVETRPTLMMSLDWNQHAFFDLEPFLTLPSAQTVEIATQAAESMTIIPHTPPAPNSSFTLQFYGPSVQCSLANSTQGAVFNYYEKAVRQSTQQTVALMNNTINSTNSVPAGTMLLLSAFAPYAGSQGWLFGIANTDSVDQFNNWNIDLPWEDLGNTADDFLYDEVVQQLWLQTSTDRYFCSMGNASYNVYFGFTDGVQSFVQSTVSNFEPAWVTRIGGGGAEDLVLPGPYNGTYATSFEYSYMSVWQAFASLISGNISMEVTWGRNESNMTFWDSSKYC